MSTTTLMPISIRTLEEATTTMMPMVIQTPQGTTTTTLIPVVIRNFKVPVAIQPGTSTVTVPLGTTVTFDFFYNASLGGSETKEVGDGLEVLESEEDVGPTMPPNQGVLAGGGIQLRDSYIAKQRGTWKFKYTSRPYASAKTVTTLVDAKIVVV